MSLSPLSFLVNFLNSELNDNIRKSIELFVTKFAMFYEYKFYISAGKIGFHTNNWWSSTKIWEHFGTRSEDSMISHKCLTVFVFRCGVEQKREVLARGEGGEGTLIFFSRSSEISFILYFLILNRMTPCRSQYDHSLYRYGRLYECKVMNEFVNTKLWMNLWMQNYAYTDFDNFDDHEKN